MSKKMLKRSLALGALMAFVITGSAVAGELNVSVTDEEVTYTFKSDYAYGIADNTTLDGKKVVIKDTVEVDKNIGLLVQDNDMLKNVTGIDIISAGNKTGLVIDSVSEVNVTAPITLSGTGNDARIEVFGGSIFTADNITNKAEKGKIQVNNDAKVVLRNVVVEDGSNLSLQTCATTGYSNEVGQIELGNVDVGNDASFKMCIYEYNNVPTPNAEITGDININLGANAVVDFGGVSSADWRGDLMNVAANSVTVNVLDSENAGKVYISEVSEIKNENISVIASGDNNTGDADADLAKLTDVVKRTSDSEGATNEAQDDIVATGVKLTQEASSIFDAASTTVSEDGTIGEIIITKNSNTYGITENNALSLMTWRAEMNDMNKRMGELRNAEGQHGVWARMVRGEAEYESVKNQYNQYQLGYDEKLSTDPSWTVGAAINYTEGDTSYSTGSAENKHVGFSVYGSKLNADGSFIDLIAKYARLENDFETTIGNGDYSSNGYSVSAEYGKRFTQESGMWIEPQVELTYGKVGSADYKMGTIDVAQDSIESLVGRVGFSLGKNISKGNVYARASYLYDFDGETAVNFVDGGKPRTMEQDLGGGWWEVGVGANINLSKATYIYADIEKTFGGEVDTNWQWNLGVRYSF